MVDQHPLFIEQRSEKKSSATAEEKRARKSGQASSWWKSAGVRGETLEDHVISSERERMRVMVEGEFLESVSDKQWKSAKIHIAKKSPLRSGIGNRKRRSERIKWCPVIQKSINGIRGLLIRTDNLCKAEVRRLLKSHAKSLSYPERNGTPIKERGGKLPVTYLVECKSVPFSVQAWCKKADIPNRTVGVDSNFNVQHHLLLGSGKWPRREGLLLNELWKCVGCVWRFEGSATTEKDRCYEDQHHTKPHEGSKNFGVDDCCLPYNVQYCRKSVKLAVVRYPREKVEMTYIPMPFVYLENCSLWSTRGDFGVEEKGEGGLMMRRVKPI
jgi:hypothetical protein